MLPDPFLKKHWKGTLVAIGVLVLVIGFWIDQAPHFHFYRIYRMKQKLRSLSLPPQSQLLDIVDFGTVKVRDLASIDSITGVYFTDLDCDVVNAHYKAEFLRKGFSYGNERPASGAESDQLSFSTPWFSARLGCSPLNAPKEQRTMYMISMTWIAPRN